METRENACVCQCSAVGHLIEDKKYFKSKKGIILKKKKHFELSSLIAWIALWIVNTYSEFQVNIFSNNRDITKCHSFCTQGYSNSSGFLPEVVGLIPGHDEPKSLKLVAVAFPFGTQDYGNMGIALQLSSSVRIMDWLSSG